MAPLTIEQIKAGVRLRLTILKMQDVDQAVTDWETAKGVNEVKSQVNRDDLPAPMLEYVVDWIVAGILAFLQDTAEVSEQTLNAGVKSVTMGDTRYDFSGQLSKADMTSLLIAALRDKNSSIVGRYRKLVW